MPNKALSLKVLLCIVLFSIFINPVYLPGAQIARAEVKPCSMVRISLETDAFLSGLTEDNENLPELVFPEYFEIGISGQLQQVRQINSQSINILDRKSVV